jgi:hypothetical protein
MRAAWVVTQLDDAQLLMGCAGRRAGCAAQRNTEAIAEPVGRRTVAEVCTTAHSPQ